MRFDIQSQTEKNGHEIEVQTDERFKPDTKDSKAQTNNLFMDAHSTQTAVLETSEIEIQVSTELVSSSCQTVKQSMNLVFGVDREQDASEQWELKTEYMTSAEMQTEEAAKIEVKPMETQTDESSVFGTNFMENRRHSKRSSITSRQSQQSIDMNTQTEKDLAHFLEMDTQTETQVSHLPQQSIEMDTQTENEFSCYKSTCTFGEIETQTDNKKHSKDFQTQTTLADEMANMNQFFHLHTAIETQTDMEFEFEG